MRFRVSGLGAMSLRIRVYECRVWSLGLAVWGSNKDPDGIQHPPKCPRNTKKKMGHGVRFIVSRKGVLPEIKGLFESPEF